MAERRMLFNNSAEESFIGTMRIEYQSYPFNLNINNNIEIIEQNYNNNDDKGYFIIGFKNELIVPENFISERVINLTIYSELDDYIIFETNSIIAENIYLYGNFKFTYKCINSNYINLYDYNYIYDNECFIINDSDTISFHGVNILQYYKNINNCIIRANPHILYDLMKYNNIEEGDKKAKNYYTLHVGSLTISSPTEYITTIPNVNLGNNNYIYAIYNCMYNGNYITDYKCRSTITLLQKGITLPQNATVYISDTITNIDNDTFKNEYNLRKVVIFGNCKVSYLSGFRDSSIESIEIYSNNITNIKESCFFNTQLTTILIPQSITTIGNSAFYNSGLTSLYIPQNVSSIGYQICAANDKIESISIDENNSVYDSRNNCNAIIKTATNTLLQGCKNTIIPYGIKTIEEYAFAYMGLENINIPDTVTSLNHGAFLSNPINEIIIPKSVKFIGFRCFINTNMYYDENNWIDKMLYISNCLIDVKKDISGDITILNGTRLIASNVFQDLENINKIYIPNSLEYINGFSFIDMGDLIIEYNGTEEEWNNIVKDQTWDDDTNITYIFNPTLF